MIKAKIAPRNLLVVLCPVLLVACRSPAENSPPEPVARPTFEAWRRIYTTEVKGLTRSRVHRGYVNHRFSRDEEGAYEIYDTSRKPVGFVLANGKAFRYEADASGKLTSRQIAYEGLDGGVLRLLEASGKVEYEEIMAGDAQTKS